jgi:hypothetical protein
MDNSKKSDSRKCLRDCEQQFRECLLNGDEEVYCRIQRVPCDSSCSEL